MLVFDHDWQSAKGVRSLDLEGRHEISLRVSCTKEVKVHAMREGQKILLKAAPEFTLRAVLVGFSKLILSGSGETEYGYVLRDVSRQEGEELTHENPPAPPLPNTSNLLLQMRDIARAEARRTQDAYLDVESYTGRYDVDDDDEDFEEELQLKARKKAEEKKKAAEKKAEPSPPKQSAPSTGSTSDPPPSVPPAAPEARPTVPGATSGAQQAAE